MAEAAGPGLVLAVHVVGDRTADRHPGAPGTRGREETPRPEHPQDLAHRDSRLAHHLAGCGVEVEEAVQPPGQHGGAVLDEGAVALAAPPPLGPPTLPPPLRPPLAPARHERVLPLRAHRGDGDGIRPAEAAERESGDPWHERAVS